MRDSAEVPELRRKESIQEQLDFLHKMFLTMFLVGPAAMLAGDIIKAIIRGAVEAQLVRKLRARIFRKLLWNDQAFYDGVLHRPKRLLMLLQNGAANVAAVLYVAFGSVAQAMGGFISAFICSMMFNWPVALSATVITVLCTGLSMPLLIKSLRSRVNSESNLMAAQRGSEALRNIRSLRAIRGGERKFLKVLDKLFVQHYSNRLVELRLQAFQFAVGNAIALSVQGFITLLLVPLFMGGKFAHFDKERAGVEKWLIKEQGLNPGSTRSEAIDALAQLITKYHNKSPPDYKGLDLLIGVPKFSDTVRDADNFFMTFNISLGLMAFGIIFLLPVLMEVAQLGDGIRLTTDIFGVEDYDTDIGRPEQKAFERAGEREEERLLREEKLKKKLEKIEMKRLKNAKKLGMLKNIGCGGGDDGVGESLLPLKNNGENNGSTGDRGDITNSVNGTNTTLSVLPSKNALSRKESRIMLRKEQKLQLELASIHRPVFADHMPVEEEIESISFRNVRFRYPGRPGVEVLKQINLEIKRGQSIAFVGNSGGGKSTAMSLLARFYDPNSVEPKEEEEHLSGEDDGEDEDNNYSHKEDEDRLSEDDEDDGSPSSLNKDKNLFTPKKQLTMIMEATRSVEDLAATQSCSVASFGGSPMNRNGGSGTPGFGAGRASAEFAGGAGGGIGDFGVTTCVTSSEVVDSTLITPPCKGQKDLLDTDDSPADNDQSQSPDSDDEDDNEDNENDGKNGISKSQIQSQRSRLKQEEQIKLIYDQPDLCGEIVINNRYRLKDLSVSAWRERIGYVGQEPVLFNLSARQNVCLGLPAGSVTDADLQRVADMARIDFLEGLSTPSNSHELMRDGDYQPSDSEVDRDNRSEALSEVSEADRSSPELINKSSSLSLSKSLSKVSLASSWRTTSEASDSSFESEAGDGVPRPSVARKLSWDEPLGLKGQRLSGGQKQRLAIARALIRKPQILLLDEATSALDNKSEKEVQKAIDRIQAKSRGTGLIMITIAHKLATIVRSDKIVCIVDGENVEEGRHKDLLKKQGFYAHLVRLARK